MSHSVELPVLPLVRPADVTDRLLMLGRVAIVVTLLTLSPFALLALNWQYFDTGGSFIDKFHPATLIAFALIALSVLLTANPVTALLRLIMRNSDMIPFVLATLFTIVYAAAVLGHPITNFIETFLGAAAVFVIFDGVDENSRRTLAHLIHLLLFINALLGIYEVATGFRLTPLVINGELLADESRASALIGHPLANAMVAGAYAVLLALGGSRDLHPILRPVVFIVALASLVPFGGRAATAACLLILAMIGAARLLRALRGARFSTNTLLATLLVIPLACAVILTALEMGALNTLLDRLVDDEGSASTRIVMFELFDHFTFWELFFGPDPAVLQTWVRLYGLEYGIESFIVAFILFYGILPALIFFPTFFYFLYALAAATGRKTWFALLYFLIVALASVSLSSKTPTFSLFIVMVLVLLGPQKSDEDLEHLAR